VKSLKSDSNVFMGCKQICAGGGGCRKIDFFAGGVHNVWGPVEFFPVAKGTPIAGTDL